MIGALVPRVFDPAWRVRAAATQCLAELLRTLGLYEGLESDLLEGSLHQLEAVSSKWNSCGAGRLESGAGAGEVGSVLVSVLGERVQHHHLLSLMDSLCEGLLDPQAGAVAGLLTVLAGLVTARGSEVHANIPGLVRKLHDKMGLMAGDETVELSGTLAGLVAGLAKHNLRGAATSLASLPLPVDREARLVWSALAAQPGIPAPLLSCLLEAVSAPSPPGSPLQAAGAAAGLQVLLECGPGVPGLQLVLETELGRLVPGLVTLLARTLGTRLSARGSVVTMAGPGSGAATTEPGQLALAALRAAFSCLGCVAVAGAVGGPAPADYTGLVTALGGLAAAVAQHAPHLLPALVTGHAPLAAPDQPDCLRVAGAAVLGAATEAGAGGDSALLARLHPALLRCCQDSLPLVRRLALAGLPRLADCEPARLEEECELALRTLLTATDDTECSSVSLAGLTGLAALLLRSPPLPLTALAPTIALKVRPFFESSSEEHRAAAISVYSGLGRLAECEECELYLEFAQSVLVPVLLHSTSLHPATATACRACLVATATATRSTQLAATLADIPLGSPFPSLAAGLLAVPCEPLQEMLPGTVTASLSYLRSPAPALRCNAVHLLAAALAVTQAGPGQDRMGVEVVGEAVRGVVVLLQDPDREVRRAAAVSLGPLAALLQQ